MSTPTTWQYSRTLRLGLALALGLTLTIVCLLSIGAFRSPDLALAQGPTVRYVAPAPTGDDSGNDCTDSSTPCATVQHAVDEPGSGDVICVATGTYTDLHVRPRNDITTTGVVTQVVYIDKTVTIRGGYTDTFTDPPDPVANPTSLDAGDQGRVLYVTGDINPTIEGLRLINGDASGLGGHLAGMDDRDAGGGVYAISATVTMSNNQVSDNFARYGGGLHFQNSANPALTGNTVSDNHVAGLQFPEGGGLAFFDSPDATLISNTISGNIVDVGYGGGLHFTNSPSATLNSNSIVGNRSRGTPCPPNCSHAGGLSCESSGNMTLTNNVIRDNNGIAGAGLLFNVCNNIQLADNVIVNNIGTGGGGLSVRGSTGVELANNVISGNTANRSGGGAEFKSSVDVTLIGNTVTDNDTYPLNGADYGAGLYFENSTNVNLVGNIVTSNTIAAFGGGLYLINSTATISNNVVTDNEVEIAGSGLYIADSSPDLLHTTIARNSGGDGSGVHITGTLSTVAMTNTILASHTLGITVEAGNTATLNGVLWHDNGTNYDGPGTIVVNNEHTGDPAFGDDGYHLTLASAAIDKGVDAGAKTDIDGFPRPCGFAPDLGADEITCIFLPIIFKNL